MNWIDTITDRSLGTGTSLTELSGDASGNAVDYTIPSPAAVIVAVRPKVYGTTPTANQSVVTSLTITSKDNYIGDFTLLANPLGSGLGTNETQAADPARWYPANIPVKAASKVNFSGQAEVANAVAPRMAVDVLLSDQPAQGPAVHYITNGQNYGNAMTSTGTATGSVSGNNITISGNQAVRVKAFYGITAATTPAASKPFGGYFQWSSPSFQQFPNPQRVFQEPIQGFLGTSTFADWARLTTAENLDLPITKMPAVISTSYVLSVAPTTAGNFEQGLAYTYQ